VGILEGDAWLARARHANAMAQRLAAGLSSIPAAELLFPVEANGVFAKLPAAVLDGLRGRGWRFYTFIGAGGARFMCGWDTQPESVDALLADLRSLSA
jgi:threonine aldolase